MAAVVISDYDPSWPALFASLASSVSAALGPVLVRVEHVGSTAVPGLAAKPILDIDVVVLPADVPEAVGRLSAFGYAHLGNLGVSGREAFAAPAGTPADHVYVCPVGSPALAEHLRFRDSLRADAELAAKYGLLKRQLAARFGSDRDGYCEAKSAFIRAALLEEAERTEPSPAAALPRYSRFLVLERPLAVPQVDAVG
jgi:GrpB-like predicted nucleotidyltransferase (UPF0157 family)